MKYSILVLILLLIVSLIFQWPVLNDLPSSIHAWAQADRYAITLGYLQNGFSFFEPQTFILNKHFPGDGKILYDTSITSVNFPIHNYIVAILMNIFQTDAPWVLRGYNLIMSIIFLFYLYRLLVFLGARSWIASSTVLFAFFSPVFIYYQANYLPTIPSLATTTIGLLYYFKFLKWNRQKYLYFAFSFLVISALNRLTFLIPLVAVFIDLFIRSMKNRNNLKHFVVPTSLSFSIILASHLWSLALRETHSSMFVSKLLYPHSMEEFIEIVKVSFYNWKGKYVVNLFLIIAGGTGLFGLISWIIKRHEFSGIAKSTIFFLSIYFSGCVLFLVAMAGQFPNHDYYFLDTFYLPGFILFGILLNRIPNIYFFRVNSAKITLAFMLFICALQASESIDKYRKVDSNDSAQLVSNNFRNSSELLNRNNVSDESRIMVFNPFGPNIPFVYFKRKGVAVMNTNDSELIQSICSWPVDFYLLQKNAFINKVYNIYPSMIDHLEYVDENEELILCRKVPKRKNTLEDIFRTDFQSNMILQFPNEDLSRWDNLNLLRDSNNLYYHNHVPEILFGLSHNQITEHLSSSKKPYIFRLLYSAITVSENTNASIVLSIENQSRDSLYFYQSVQLFPNNQFLNKPFNGIAEFRVPQMDTTPKKVSLYLFNPGKHEFKLYSLKGYKTIFE